MQPRILVIYYSRVTGYPFTIEQALAAEQIRLPERAENHANSIDPKSSTPSLQEDQTKEDYVLTFAELQELIAAGQVEGIPNNKVILDGLNVRRCPPAYSPPRSLLSRKRSQAHPYLQPERSHGRLLSQIQ
jgi:hypothetical protein